MVGVGLLSKDPHVKDLCPESQFLPYHRYFIKSADFDDPVVAPSLDGADPAPSIAALGAAFQEIVIPILVD